MYDLLIANAQIVSPQDTVHGDVAIRGERVAAVLEPGSGAPAQKTIDAGRKYLLPGLIDPHTHIEHSYTPEIATRDDFFTMIRKESATAKKILWNFLQVLTHRLRQTNLDLKDAKEAAEVEDLSDEILPLE